MRVPASMVVRMNKRLEHDREVVPVLQQPLAGYAEPCGRPASKMTDIPTASVTASAGAARASGFAAHLLFHFAQVKVLRRIDVGRVRGSFDSGGIFTSYFVVNLIEPRF